MVALGWGDSQEGGGGGGREGGDPFRGIPPSSPSPLLALVRTDQREGRTRMAFSGWLLALDKLLAFDVRMLLKILGFRASMDERFGLGLGSGWRLSALRISNRL